MYKAATVAVVAAGAASAAELLQAPVGEAIAGQYIVRLRNARDGAQLQSAVEELSGLLGAEMTPRHIYSGLAKHGFSAFSAKLSKAAVEILSAHEGVQYIEENKEVTFLLSIVICLNPAPAPPLHTPRSHLYIGSLTD